MSKTNTECTARPTSCAPGHPWCAPCRARAAALLASADAVGLVLGAIRRREYPAAVLASATLEEDGSVLRVAFDARPGVPAALSPVYVRARPGARPGTTYFDAHSTRDHMTGGHVVGVTV